MEIKELLYNDGIIGVISNYKSTLKNTGKVSSLNINNINNALKMVSLNSDIIDKDLQELSLNELWKVELATKLNEEIIIVGNMSTSLNYKEIEYMKKLFLKLNNNYHKKIIIIDNDVKVFFGLVKRIFVLKNHHILYETTDLFNDELYKYTKMPPIIDFIKYVNKENKNIKNTTEIYELIKDIYRSVS